MHAKRIFALFIVFFLLGASCFVPNFAYAGEVKTVVIDAGHGGVDPGAIGKIVKEKDIALAIALKLGHYIETKLIGVKVLYTRTTDVYPTLNARADLANENNADLFISIHVNSAANTSAAGTETLVMGSKHGDANMEALRENQSVLFEKDYEENYEWFNSTSPEAQIILELFQSEFLEKSNDFAYEIQHQFKNRAGRRSRGVKQQPLLVLYETTMPGVLIETGFISNLAEEKYLASERGQDLIASAIYRAFRDYKSKVEGVDASTFQVKETTTVKPLESKPATEVLEEKVIEKKDVPAEKIEKTEVPQVKLEEKKEDFPVKKKETKTDKEKKKESSEQKSGIADFAKELIGEKEEKVVDEKEDIEPGNTKESKSKGGEVALKASEKEKVVVNEKKADVKKVKRDVPKLQFKVQVKSSTREIELISENFKGLKNISMYVDKGVNKFVYGSEDSIDGAVNLQSKARAVGFEDAFVVSFYKGKRIPMSQALKMEREGK